MNTALHISNLVRSHGLTVVTRSGTYLASVAIWMRQNDSAQAPTQAELSRYWDTNLRTVEREAAAWRKLTNGADVGPVALEVLAAQDAVPDERPTTAAAFGALAFVRT